MKAAQLKAAQLRGSYLILRERRPLARYLARYRLERLDDALRPLWRLGRGFKEASGQHARVDGDAQAADLLVEGGDGGRAFGSRVHVGVRAHLDGVVEGMMESSGRW